MGLSKSAIGGVLLLVGVCGTLVWFFTVRKKGNGDGKSDDGDDDTVGGGGQSGESDGSGDGDEEKEGDTEEGEDGMSFRECMMRLVDVDNNIEDAKFAVVNIRNDIEGIPDDTMKKLNSLDFGALANIKSIEGEYYDPAEYDREVPKRERVQINKYTAFGNNPKINLYGHEVLQAEKNGDYGQARIRMYHPNGQEWVGISPREMFYTA